MVYVLEKISESDMDLIISHVDGDKYRHTKFRFTEAKKDGTFTKNWSVDRERNAYFLKIPNVMREDPLSYCIFFQGYLYQIDEDEFVGHGFRFAGHLDINSVQLEDLKQEIKLAFACYGKFGTGTLNSSGKPTLVVNPKFL